MVMDAKKYFYIWFFVYILLHGCATDNSIKKDNNIKYCIWAIEDRQDGKPVFSACASEAYIQKFMVYANKTYYTVFYENGQPKTMIKYVSNKIERISYFNERGIRIKYIEKNKNNECDISYKATKDLKIKHIINCSDGNIYINTYKDWGLIDTETYKDNRLIKKVSIAHGLCQEFDKNNKLLKKYECYPYEETQIVFPPGLK